MKTDDDGEGAVMANPESKKPEQQDSPQRGEDCLEMKIPALAEWVRVVRLATAGVASRVGFSYDDTEDIKLAVAEACNNAILHSSSESSHESTSVVTVRWQVLSDGVRISVSDEGRLDAPVAPRSAVSESTSLDEVILDALPEGGMGLLLIESLMDEVEHQSGPHQDTTIHMTKRLPARPDPDSPVRVAPAQTNQTPVSSPSKAQPRPTLPNSAR